MLVTVLVTSGIVHIIELIIHHLSPSDKNLEVKIKISNTEVTVKATTPFWTRATQDDPIIIGIYTVVSVLINYFDFPRDLLIYQRSIRLIQLPDTSFFVVIECTGRMADEPAVGYIISSSSQFYNFFFVGKPVHPYMPLDIDFINGYSVQAKFDASVSGLANIFHNGGYPRTGRKKAV